MATQLKKTVKPSSGDYTTLEACMNANEKSLTGSDEYFDVEIDGAWSSADTTACTIHNYTTDATRYINIYTTSAARHLANWSASYYQLHITAGTALTISSGNLTITGLQIGVTCAADYATRYGIVVQVAAPVRIDKCYLHADDSGTGKRCRLLHHAVSGAGDLKATNTVFYHTGTGGDSGYGNGVYAASTSGSAYIENCTFRNCKTGIARTASTVYGYNNLFDSCTADFSGTVTEKNNSTTNDNTKGCADATDTVSITAGKFTSATDCHITSDSGAVDKADSSLVASLFSDDIDGVTRSGTWDCGADEYVAAGGYIPYPTSRGTRGGIGAMSGGLQ